MKAYDDVFKTPGAVSWTELMTSDPDAAVKFYGALFGWTFDKMDMGMPYNVIRVGDAAVGGIMGMAPGTPAPGWVGYVTVASADATAEQCKALGGKVLHGPADIPTVGRLVVRQDPQGARINAISYQAPAG